MRSPFTMSRAVPAIVAGLAVAMISAAPARAQSDNPLTGRLMIGGSTPSGGIKDRYDAGGLVGVQASYRINKFLDVTANSAWQNAPLIRADNVGDNSTAWTIDAGLEGRMPSIARTMGSMTIQPYIGAGWGQRSYNLSKSLGTSTTSSVTYAALGGDFNTSGMWGFRLEARDYFGSFNDPERLTPKKSGSDLGIAIGVTLK
ncbi:MAG TPA: outer membrane beta-barrel protein [Gemmatimonadaceae bacterium]|nr:outer membrane beta-barrel protein [Gemmatimonadaceae bacterium]